MTLFDPSPLAKIPPPLLAWFRARARSLPWRDDPRPYYVWVSEIMLQQTRVTAVMPYFARFVEALPDVAALAAADDDALMKLWEGLGYYARARNLKKAAALVMERHGGIIPRDFDALLALPGIGRYTAGAIASIAYGEPRPAVDGNVLRVVMRLVASRADILRDATKRAVEDALTGLMPKEPGLFNQALMELGALVCLPRAARCEACPLVALCLARAAHIENELPVRAPKKARRVEARTVLLLERGGRYAILKRLGRGLLAGLWELPNIAGTMTRKDIAALLKDAGFSLRSLRRLADARHIFTHIEWALTGWHARLADDAREGGERARGGPSPLPPLTWAAAKELTTVYGIPAAFRPFLPDATKK